MDQVAAYRREVRRPLNARLGVAHLTPDLFDNKLMLQTLSTFAHVVLRKCKSVHV
jgi:hypothetical protein